MYTVLVTCIFERVNTRIIYGLDALAVCGPIVVTFIPTYARSLVRTSICLLAGEFVPRCSALMDGRCFRTFYRRLELIGFVRMVTTGGKTSRIQHRSGCAEFRTNTTSLLVIYAILSLNALIKNDSDLRKINDIDKKWR